jgi:hypothetical protein
MGDLDWGVNFSLPSSSGPGNNSEDFQTGPAGFDWNVNNNTGTGQEASNGFGNGFSSTPAKDHGHVEAVQGASGIFDSPFAGMHPLI